MAYRKEKNFSDLALFPHIKRFLSPAIVKLLTPRAYYRLGRKNVRTWRLVIAHIQSAWNYQKRFIVNGSRGGFLINQWLCCSTFRAIAMFGFLHNVGKG
jgi:hypothetical protein